MKRLTAVSVSISMFSTSIFMTGCASNAANPVPAAQVGELEYDAQEGASYSGRVQREKGRDFEIALSAN